MSYNSSDDLGELITSIKDTYNIDSFSDLVFSVFVVNFDADTKILKQLCAMLDGAKDLNVVNAAFILPFASGKKEKFKKDENRTAQILESDYHICLNEDFSIVCEKAASGVDENTQILVAEDFAFIFNLNARDFGLLEEEIKTVDVVEEPKVEAPKKRGRKPASAKSKDAEKQVDLEVLAEPETTLAEEPEESAPAATEAAPASVESASDVSAPSEPEVAQADVAKSADSTMNTSEPFTKTVHNVAVYTVPNSKKYATTL